VYFLQKNLCASLAAASTRERDGLFGLVNRRSLARSSQTTPLRYPIDFEVFFFVLLENGVTAQDMDDCYSIVQNLWLIPTKGFLFEETTKIGSFFFEKFLIRSD